MPGPRPPDRRESSQDRTRDAATRAADHAAIERLTAELLPALIVKLSASGLGELEVREGAWKVRLRRPGDGSTSRERRPERSGRSAGGGIGHAVPGTLTPVGPGREGREGRDRRRVVATSPAVGIFQPRPEARSGTTVRAGDRLGAVDVLGVAQEVVAPIDGVVGSSLVEPGDAVEYGQELVVIELPAAPSMDA